MWPMITKRYYSQVPLTLEKSIRIWSILRFGGLNGNPHPLKIMVSGEETQEIVYPYWACNIAKY